MTSLVHKFSTDMLFSALFTPSFYDFSYTFVYKLRSKRWLSSDHAGMNKISCEVSIFYLNSD